MTYSYSHPRPAVTVDTVIFGVDPREEREERDDRRGPPALQVLLVKRAHDPCQGMWALPGGYVEVRDDGDQGEDLEDAARRELREETAVAIDALEQLCTVGTPGRDPRSRVITVVYTALVRSTDHVPAAGDDAASAQWIDVGRALGETPGLAFDHTAILRTALARLQAQARRAPRDLRVSPQDFTPSELRTIDEIILGCPFELAAK